MFKIMVIGFSVLVIGVTAWYFSDNIKGYYKFKHLCENEGGLKVYEKLEPNVGWEARSKYSAYMPASIQGVKFVRFESEGKPNKFFDMKYMKGKRTQRSSKKIIDADLSFGIKYKYSYVNKTIDKKLLISVSNYEIFDIEKKAMVLRFTGFGYSMFDRNKTILHAPSGTACHQFDRTMISDNFK